ncbi:MAG: hypothetical protein K9J06_12100 [Flavobacteriales bacterium]|nr:hypothetical protein [Flavobacteriales bacterium]
MNVLVRWSLYAMLVTALAGCEVFTDLGLKNAIWRLYDIRTSNANYNLMTLRMQDYRENDPTYRYIIHFYEDDRCTGTYYAADTVNYEVEGTWSLPEHDILRIELDGVVNGDFLITKLERHVFFLTTEQNYHGLPIEPPYFPMDMYIERFY